MECANIPDSVCSSNEMVSCYFIEICVSCELCKGEIAQKRNYKTIFIRYFFPDEADHFSVHYIVQHHYTKFNHDDNSFDEKKTEKLIYEERIK